MKIYVAIMQVTQFSIYASSSLVLPTFFLSQIPNFLTTTGMCFWNGWFFVACSVLPGLPGSYLVFLIFQKLFWNSDPIWFLHCIQSDDGHPLPNEYSPKLLASVFPL